MKQSTISSLSFKTAKNSTAFKFMALSEAVDALPATVTAASGNLVKAAQEALDALNAEELAKYKAEEAARYTKLENAIATYDNIAVSDCIAKINAIGTVNANSGDAIYAAQQAYNALNATQKSKVTNYSTLAAALEQWSNYAVTSINDQISKLVNVDSLNVADQTAILNAKAAYEKVQTAYGNLDNNQKAQINNYNIVPAGLTKIAQLEKLFDFKAALAAFSGTTVDGSNLAAATSLKELYTGLTTVQQNALTGDEKTKYSAIEASFNDLANQAKSSTFIGGTPSLDMFQSTGSKQNAKKRIFTVTLTSASWLRV